MRRVLDTGVACLLASGVLLLYARPLAAMVDQWNASPMYSYAFTVPLISLYILWSRRAELLGERPAPARAAGLAATGGGVLLLVLGEVGGIQVVQQLSFLCVLAGLVLFLFGARYLRVSAPALLYLLFMVPFWDAFTEPLHWPFQQNSARLGVAMLHAVGVPAYREGTVIALSTVTIEVARACSGVNYLIAVLALALPLAYLRLPTWGRRAALIASALVISTLANGLRVALIGVLAHYEIGSPLHGPFHVLHGLFVAAVGYVALFAGLRLLEPRRAEPAPVAPAAPGGGASWRVREACALAVAFHVLGFVGTTPASAPVALAMPFDRLPGTLGAWQEDPVHVGGSDGVLAWNDADARLRRRYYRADGQSATVDVWYFEAQRQSREVVNFRTASLHQQALTRRVAAPDGPSFPVNLVRLPGEVGLFWYVLDGHPEADQYAAKLRSLWTVLTSGRSNGAAVMLRAPSAGDDERALAGLEDLAAEVHVALGPHWHAHPPRPR